MDLNGSHLFGQDDIPLRSQLDFSNGELLGLRHSDTPVGLVTLWEVNDFGKVVLRTTRLPERNEPYNLNLELARGRLLKISQKREEWGMMDLILTEKQHEIMDTALESFITALSNMDNGEAAAQAADESLSWALRVGEDMSLSHAQNQLEKRFNGPGISRHCFGLCLDPSRMGDQKYLQFIKENFSFVTLPISWRQIETKEQERNFDLIDEWINWLSRNYIAIKVGPLINFTPLAVPDWLYIWENDFDQVRDMAYDYITAVVQRYSKQVHAWDVVSGLNVENCFKFSFEQIIEITRSCVLAARHAAPRSLILVEVSEPWGDYYAFNQRSIPPMVYIDMICQSGVTFNAIGLKMRFGRSGGGMQMRDLLDISSMLDRIGIFGKTVHLSGVQVPSAADKRDNNNRPGDAGYWRGAWSEETQAQWLEQVYKIALSRPYIETVTWQDLVDREEGILQSGGLLKQDFSSKKAFEKLCQMKNNLVRPTRHDHKSKKPPAAK